MTIKCPVCGAEYSEGTVRFCKICMYSIGSDPYLTDLLNHPSEEELRLYNQSLEEFRSLYNPRIPTNTERKKRTTKTIAHKGFVEMVKVKGGTFIMGDNGGNINETPNHLVTVRDFLIAKYSVTYEAWETITGDITSKYKNGKIPVTEVSWYEAVDFCNKASQKENLKPAYKINKESKDPNNKCEFDKEKWFVECDLNANGYRLPTEAEWEFAARGGIKSKHSKYSGSNSIFVVARYDRNSAEGAHFVGSKLPNELGIYDMSGNVWEWCWDWWGEYNPSPQKNPIGPESGSVRVGRGGSWKFDEGNCRVSHRICSYPGYKDNDLGFRLVRTKI